jgi:beta-galactosidase
MKYKFLTLVVSLAATIVVTAQREHININSGWRFMRYDSAPDSLLYDVRPEITHHNDNMVADTKPVESAQSLSSTHTLKKWILPVANEFIKDPAKHHQRPEGNPGNDFPFVQNNFNDNRWQLVDLPHDWAIQAPFYKGNNTEVGGGMGRLPSQGVAWYRRSLFISKNDKNKII